MEKNLRPLTILEQKQKQLEELQAEIDQMNAPRYNKEELLELLIPYENDLINQEAAISTRKKYLSVAKKFIEDYASEGEPLEKSDVLHFKEDLIDDGYKDTTINNKITVVNRFLYYCEQGDLTVKGIKTQSNNVLEHRLYQHEYARLYNRAKAIGDLELHYIIKVMGGTGVRADEIKWFTSDSIKRSDIQVTNKGKTRTVPIPGPLVRELRKWVKDSGIEGRLFTKSYRQIYDGMKDLATYTKIKKDKVHPHAFRHYFGFRFVDLKGGLKLAQLSDILGHGSVETTRIYTRGTLEDYKKTMEEM